MAIIVPATWSNTSAYTVGSTAYYNGVIYECIVAVDSDSNGNDIPVDNSSWKVSSVIRIEDYYSLQEAVNEAMNSEDEFIENSIPLFIQSAEVQLSKLLQHPAQKITRVYELDSDSKFAIPNDLLVIEHLRINEDDGDSYDLRSRGSIVIVSAERSEFEILKQTYEDSRNYEDYNYTFPGYRTDDEFIYIAPSYDSGTEVELTYYQDVPSLGTTVNLVRVVDGEEVAINDSDQTLDEWVADGNAAADFVQGTETVLTNLWTATLPHVLKTGALAEGFMYLKNQEQAGIWQQKFQELMQETKIQIDNFETDRDQGLYQNTAY